ncbi:MAG: hypothetical protein NT094_00740 [Candidatus Staskawiczbacteria bacterium]|jgi:hypothetical protein|nr:hypothetical protein [Candidatus Staskawiczbacteria bacterium]
MNNEQANKIIDLLQNLFILEAKKNGLTSEEVRKILGVNNNKIFKIWKLSKPEKKKVK